RASRGRGKKGAPDASSAAPSRNCRPGSDRLMTCLRAPVAQLDRALPSEGRGREFESRRARHWISRLAEWIPERLSPSYRIATNWTGSGAHTHDCRAKPTLVLPGERGTPFSGWSKAKSALDTASGVSGWWLHDLRRTVATGLQRLGVRLEVTEAVLNHLSGSRAGVVGIYQRHDWAEEKRAALDAW